MTAFPTEAAVSCAAEEGSGVPPTRRNSEVRGNTCSCHLEHRSKCSLSSTMADWDAVSPTRCHKTANHKVTKQQGPCKASPFFVRCRPSRSHRRCRHPSYSDVSSDSRSSRSSGSSSSSRHRSRHRSRRHHRGQSSSLEKFSESPFSSCTTAPTRYLVKKITQGKFVKFDRLLPPIGSKHGTYSWQSMCKHFPTLLYR